MARPLEPIRHGGSLRRGGCSLSMRQAPVNLPHPRSTMSTATPPQTQVGDVKEIKRCARCLALTTRRVSRDPFADRPLGRRDQALQEAIYSLGMIQTASPASAPISRSSIRFRRHADPSRTPRQRSFARGAVQLLPGFWQPNATLVFKRTKHLLISTPQRTSVRNNNK